jgi:hypothetical protein
MGWVLSVTSRPLYPLDKRLGGPQSWSGHRGQSKIICLCQGSKHGRSVCSQKMKAVALTLQNPNCPMFAVRLWITASPYRWSIGSLPSTCMLCTPPALHQGRLHPAGINSWSVDSMLDWASSDMCWVLVSWNFSKSERTQKENSKFFITLNVSAINLANSEVSDWLHAHVMLQLA